MILLNHCLEFKNPKHENPVPVVTLDAISVAELRVLNTLKGLQKVKTEINMTSP